MKLSISCLLVCLSMGSIGDLNVYADGDPPSALEISGVAVKATKVSDFVEPKLTETATQSTLTKDSIELLGTPAQTSIYKVLSLLPSIHVDTADPYGFSSRSPFNIRVRGQGGLGMSTMVEGVPVWAIESPGPRMDMFDLENIGSMTLYRGAVPPDKGLGAMDTAGTLDIGILKPAEKFGVTVDQSAGSDGFLRTYGRIDSGKLLSDIKSFLSYSYSTADKWRGEGGAPDYRDHVSLGVTKDFSSAVSTELYGDYNEQKLHAFRALTFPQAQNLSTYNNFDYNTSITGNAATDINYYDFNREQSTNSNFMGTVSIRPTSSSLITIKPYYWSEERQVLSGLATIPGSAPSTPGVRERTNHFDRFGTVLEYKLNLLATDFTLGYWYESYDMAIGEKYFGIANGALVFNKWLLTTPDARGNINSPYLKLAKDYRKFHLDLGLRYLNLDDPGQTGFQSAGLADGSYDAVLHSNPVRDPAASYHGRVNREWLPFAGLSYTLAPEVSVYATYGKNYARPQSYPELMQTFISNRSTYTNAGVTMQTLYDNMKLATSDNYELGVRFKNDKYYIAPSVFYAEYQNKLVTVIDPAVNTPIRMSVAQTTVYGAELEVGANPVDNLKLYGSFSYNISEIQSNLQTATNTLINCKGKITPDTPEFLAKLGLTYNLFGLDVSPVARFVDSRYGDVQNTQEIPAYFVADLNLTYKFKDTIWGIKELAPSLSILNIFDKRYIGVITAFEDSASGTYLQGAPLTVAFSIGGKI